MSHIKQFATEAEFERARLRWPALAQTLDDGKVHYIDKPEFDERLVLYFPLTTDSTDRIYGVAPMINRGTTISSEGATFTTDNAILTYRLETTEVPTDTIKSFQFDVKLSSSAPANHFMYITHMLAPGEYALGQGNSKIAHIPGSTSLSANSLVFNINNARSNQTTKTLSKNTWYRVVIVRRDGYDYIYINGQFIGNYSTYKDGSSKPNAIGCLSFGSGWRGIWNTIESQTFPGTIKEVKAYNEALSAEEALELSIYQ